MFHLVETACNPHVFYCVVGVAYTGGVDKSERDAAEVYRVFNHIARCAVYVAHNSLFFVEQRVQECGLSCIGFTDNRYGYSIFEDVSHAE